MNRHAALIAVIVCFMFGAPARSELREVRELHYQMGTVLDITIWHSDAREARNLIRSSVQEVHRLEEIFSDYDLESALSLFNDRAGEGKIKLDAELYRLLGVANDLSLRTEGYFDVTVGPLMALWRDAGEKSVLPDHSALARTLKLVGFRKLVLYNTGEAQLSARGMKVDLGGIGKGFAVDRVADILRRARIPAALINFGGSSIYALGSPPRQEGWAIGVKGLGEDLVGVIHLKDRALSTSGSLGRSWTIGGVRYGHLIDPKTGAPVTQPRSATAIAPTATEAEALTKPLALLGEQGITLGKNFPDAEFLVVSEDGKVHLSKKFAAAGRFRSIDNR